jgi:CDP-diacylglycerol--serine O-phosphatidyltransferase
MVSTLRYRTFKDLRLSPTSATLFLLVCVGGVLVATQLHPSFVLVAYFSAYLVLGFVESGFHLRHRLVTRKVGATAAGAAVLDDEEEDVDEQDYL